jgi:hypothetical protein
MKDAAASNDGPRIVNIINFVRGVEPRTNVDLYEPVAQQVALLNKYDLPGTFLLQYDALMQPRFIKLMKEQLNAKGEIGGWFEVVQPMVEEAGLTWRGRYPWDWHTNVGFSVGYSPEEREKLVDVFMHGFEETFGYLPKSVGSWFMDAHTLAYMADKYGVSASCNCKDQIGTDGYTLWGGYWNQAYYPSRLNALMPAQSVAEQIPIPVFRMLGSDPIYQYECGLGENGQGVVSLEPVYKGGGGNPPWVRWFFNIVTEAPCLAFAYAQAGQENSFGWPDMAAGLTDQVELLAELQRQGKVRVETLAAAAEWFRGKYPLTPATAVVALDDYQKHGHKSVWYDSRFYRANLFWEDGTLRIRDIHKFDERYPERYLKDTVSTTWCAYDTLPIVDGFVWSTPGILAGLRPVRIAADGSRAVMKGGTPEVRSTTPSELFITWPLEDGGALEVKLDEHAITLRCPGAASGSWGLELAWSPEKKVPLTETVGQELRYIYEGFSYDVPCAGAEIQRVEDAPAVLLKATGDTITITLDDRP